MSELTFYNLHDQLSLIEVSGEDSAEFLQGQLTNDIYLVNENSAVLSGLCNAKGRLLAIFLIVKIDDKFYLICPREISENISKKLTFYILRSKVKITLDPPSLSLHGFISETVQKLQEFFNSIPENTLASQKNDHNLIIRMPAVSQRYLAICDKKTTEELSKSCIEKSGEYDQWKLEDIKAGIPNIYLKTQEAFIPQSLNLDLINAISFKKGCYTGQEIVARTHYLGKVKRRMYRAIIEIHSKINFGDELFVENLSVGKVVEFAKTKSNIECLVELKVDENSNCIKLNGEEIIIHELSQK